MGILETRKGCQLRLSVRTTGKQDYSVGIVDSGIRGKVGSLEVVLCRVYVPMRERRTDASHDSSTMEFRSLDACHHQPRKRNMNCGLRMRRMCGLAFLSIAVPCLNLVGPNSLAKETDFLERQKEIKQRFEKRRNKPKNKFVHDPPMIQSQDSSLGEDEPVIGVSLRGEARAYPLTMLYGGGIFELLNDTCGEVPIAVSW